MAIHKTPAIVIGRRELGESDRLVDFYTLEFGKLRGVAKAARRVRSRFGSALELFTLGELVFFDTGRSELVRVDHFDIVTPFVGLREHLERRGQGAWAIECVARLSADRDPHPALFRLLVRDLRPRCARSAFAVARNFGDGGDRLVGDRHGSSGVGRGRSAVVVHGEKLVALSASSAAHLCCGRWDHVLDRPRSRY